MRRGVLVLALWVAACGGAEPGASRDVIAGTVPIVPDTQTVDGVLVMRHGADAFERAPRWVLDTAPTVVYHDASDPQFDLTHVPGIQHPFLLSDGRMVAIGLTGRIGIMVFGPDGRPERLLAPLGQGPGAVSQSHELTAFTVADTVLVLDPGNRRVSRFHASRGLIDDQPWDIEPRSRCRAPYGLLAGETRYLVACAPASLDPRSDRPLVAYGLSDRQLGDGRVVLELPGRERREMPNPEGRSTWRQVMLGRQTYAVPWDSVIAYATQETGYELSLADTAGVLRGRIMLDVVRRPMAPEAREAFIARDLASAPAQSAHGGIPVSELERRAREQPIADSLPWMRGLIVGADGLLWVLDPVTLTDSTWSATAFGPTGVLMGRLSGKGAWNEGPAWFGRDEVLLRRVDDDGVVRYELFSVRTEGAL